MKQMSITRKEGRTEEETRREGRIEEERRREGNGKGGKERKQ